MKNLILTILIVLAPLTALAQNADFDKLFDKYTGQTGYTTMDFTGALLKMLTGNDKDSAFKGLGAMKLIVAQTAADNFEREALAVTSRGGFTKLVDINNGDETFNIWHKETGKGGGKAKEKSEFVMYVFDGSEAVVMYIEGDVDIASLANLSKITLGSR